MPVYCEPTRYNDWREAEMPWRTEEEAHLLFDALNWCKAENNTLVSDIELKFREIVKNWKQDTEHLSSVTRMVAHPDYLRIIGMGQEVLPLLLAELKRRPDWWFAALTALTGENPVDRHSRFDQAVKAWLDWGSAHGYVD